MSHTQTAGPAAQAPATAVYALIDPRSDQLRYIGKALDVGQRDRNHFNQGKYERSRKGAWIRELRAAGLRPDLIVIEECTPDESATREKYWIARARWRGIPLLNMKHGGQGRLNTSEETRARISASNKGKGHGPEWRANHAAFMRGRKQSAETRAKKGRSLMKNHNARKWNYTAIFPDGKREEITSIGVFCKEHGIGPGSIHCIAASGKGQTRNGLRFVRAEHRKCSPFPRRVSSRRSWALMTPKR
jgi:hypothetical protein